jgi:hypothetical protein
MVGNTWNILSTWEQFIMVRNTKKERQVIANITSLWINQDVPESQPVDINT